MRIARLEKQSSTNYLIKDFEVPSNLDKDQIESELVDQLHDMFDGSARWQITDFEHNNKWMEAKGTFSFKAPITFEPVKSVMQLILDGDVRYDYYGRGGKLFGSLKGRYSLDEDDITMFHFDNHQGTTITLRLNEIHGQTILELDLYAEEYEFKREYEKGYFSFYEEAEKLLLDHFSSWTNLTEMMGNLDLEKRFQSPTGDNVKVAKKAVSIARKIEKLLKPVLKRHGIRL